MARLNISLPADLYEATKKWRGARNLSQICAQALAEELDAAETARAGEGLATILQPESRTEQALRAEFGLAEASVVDAGSGQEELRDALGRRGAEYLNRWLCDGSLLAIAGGRQMWGVVRHLSPRSVRVTITAVGVEQNDPRVLHVHPNTLTTLLWLLYSPGAAARLVAAIPPGSLWFGALPPASRPSYFVLASCGPFSEASPFASLIGADATAALLRRRAAGDFNYVFFDQRGKILELAPDWPLPGGLRYSSVLPAALLRGLSARPDARVILVAGGSDKLPAISNALRHRLCNVLITDGASAAELLERKAP
ncbi:MAG TPA: sugar-binding domain-containing protein [Thermoanaerobaculia bacterium]|nr:sugar-binding domain-containing protein [Thermoanaerobaculia bacterium]